MAELMLEMWVAESQLGTIRGKVLSLTLGLGKMAQAAQRGRRACLTFAVMALRSPTDC